ncbi:MAG: hypothetical protein MRJ92_12880 [Nitrospira sp.]|nr:hypothetical protein [Nitrospira sp.]
MCIPDSAGQGIYLYPGRSDGRRKLRLLYEANPMAMVVEHAGGKATLDQAFWTAWSPRRSISGCRSRINGAKTWNRQSL